MNRRAQTADGYDAATRSSRLIDTFLKTGCILLPEEVDAHGVHADPFCPGPFLIDLNRIKGRLLPISNWLIADLGT